MRTTRYSAAWVVASLVYGVCPLASAQETVRPLGDVLDEYVRAGLESNLSLRGQTLEVERSLAELDAARGRFLPAFGLEARYMLAESARDIAIPVSSLLNPVYSTLNVLHAA